MNIIVCAKQVLDPETPVSGLVIDEDSVSITSRLGTPPVLNGFDENAVEAALRIKDTNNAQVTIISIGNNFVMDVMKKPISMGADNLVLVQGSEFENLDPFTTANVLSCAIKKIGVPDLILCGRQASDWDNSQVPLVLAELLDFTCLTLAQDITLESNTINIERVIPDGYQVLESSLPALVTVSNEFGEPRYPTLRGIMNAGKKEPEILSYNDLDINLDEYENNVTTLKLSIPESEQDCEFIQGVDDEESGRLLAFKLREAGLI
ncbi:MAG: electron transfer flavoprotein subunit beta/FixA family protein [Chloroflexota bacterium]